MYRKPAHPLRQWTRFGAFVLLSAVISYAQPPKSTMPRSERHESKHEIDQLEETWRSALLHRDTAALAPLLSDDFIGISANGTLQSKDETLSSLSSGTMQFSQMELSDRKVRFYGQTALVTSRAEITGVTPNGPISGSYRYTRVYVRDAKGAWKAVSFEASRIRDAEEHR